MLLTSRIWLFLVLLALLSGCATFTESFRQVEKRMAKSDFAGALAKLEKNKGPERDHALYLLNKGMLLRLDGKLDESNQVFEQAKNAIEKVQAISITETASQVSVNDAMRSYAGESYEQVLLHLYKALNYLELGEIDSARIEALQVDVKLQELSGKAFNKDAFARYLMGIIFEALGEYDDALIAYRKALETFEATRKDYRVDVPSTLKADLLRLSQRQGFRDEHRRYKKQFSLSSWVSDKEMKGKGEVIVFVHNNLAPRKLEHSISAHGADGKLHRVSTPYYRSRPLYVADVKVFSGSEQVRGDVVENIDAIAKTTLQRQMPGIIARAVARVVVKNKAADKAGEHSGALGVIVNIASVVSERADTRSWITLPHNIYLARLPLDAGTYNVNVELRNSAGGIVSVKTFNNINIKSGEKVFKSMRWVSGSAK